MRGHLRSLRPFPAARALEARALLRERRGLTSMMRKVFDLGSNAYWMLASRPRRPHLRIPRRLRALAETDPRSTPERNRIDAGATPERPCL